MFLATVRFFFNDAATPGIYTYGHTLSLHDALPFFLNLRAWAGGERHRHEPERGDQRGHDHGPEPGCRAPDTGRSEEHTSELQSLMRISYAVFCLKKQSITQNYKTLTYIDPYHDHPPTQEVYSYTSKQEYAPE